MSVSTPLTDYYDVKLKQRRQQMLLQNAGFRAVNDRLEADGVLMDLIAEEKPDVVIHLAAQAGVRYSIDNPRSYVEANLIGTFNLLEAVRATPVKHLLMASTSSVFGANTAMPYAETDKADTQMSFYAATKKANEAMGHSYAHLYDIPTTMFRFFTVYGPWGTPGYGPVQVHQGHSRRQTDRRLQSRRYAAGISPISTILSTVSAY